MEKTVPKKEDIPRISIRLMFSFNNNIILNPIPKVIKYLK